MHFRGICVVGLWAAATSIANPKPQNAFLPQLRVHFEEPTIKAFVPWPDVMVESHGDYREEAYLEELIGGSLYERQKDLPLLPVPSLQGTIERFISSALPLARDEGEKKTLLDACEQFSVEARHLQKRLLKRQERMNDSSWLQKIWNTEMYLQYRDPVAVFVSYFIHLNDDHTLPQKSSWPGIQRAASILVTVADYRKQVCSGRKCCDSIRNEPLCSVGFKYLFNACRVPQEEQDTYRLYDPSRHKHCIVACKGRFFSLEFVDDKMDPLPLDVLEERLNHCVELAENYKGSPPPKFGWLTSCDRDFWAASRELLLQEGGDHMKEALSKLESGAFLLCLDDVEPTSITEAANGFWHGNDSCGCNRWFDKSIQIMCTRNGKISYMGEHSMLDAMPPLSLFTQLSKRTYKHVKSRQVQVDRSDLQESVIEDIFEGCSSFGTNALEKINQMVSTAEEHHKNLTSQYELQVLEFDRYGKNFIKEAGFSPDAYVQMAMQLATYRLFHQQVATYEATQVRRFLHGRTETTRSVSSESNAFVRRMGLQPNNNDSTESRLEKLSLLQQAVAKHAAFTHDASEGMGVDRHFLGLSTMSKAGEKLPSLFSHPLYLRSKRWRISTSTLPYAPGFGPVVDDGVGIGYGISRDSCLFTCTARREHSWVKDLCHFLDEALSEMGALLEPEQSLHSRL